MNNYENKVGFWHEHAMDLAEMAFFANRAGNNYNYWKLIQRALNYEKAAAKVLSENYSIEPSRSVLYLGAIHFALNLDHFEEARYLLNEALRGNPTSDIKDELEKLQASLELREQIKSRAIVVAKSAIDNEVELDDEKIKIAIDTSIFWVEKKYGRPESENLLNRIGLEVALEKQKLVISPEYQIFENEFTKSKWLNEKKDQLSWSFWKAYKTFLEKKQFASTTITRLDNLTNDILVRLGDPAKGDVWDKRGMIVGDVQSGKTSNYIGLINKAADLGFRIVIVLTGLYESLRQQTQLRIDEGFIGVVSDVNSADADKPIGVEFYRNPKKIPVHPITRSGDAGDLRKSSLPNYPINTNDYYAIVVKKNPAVLKTLLNWLWARGEKDGDYKIIKNTPVLVIDDEADYASLNVDKEFVSRINGYIRAVLALFQQSAFIGYTATPFANVFISDLNVTEGKDIEIERRRFRLGEDLFPRDFIINIPPPSNYIGYSKVFDSKVFDESNEPELAMVNIINDYEQDIPKGHKKNDKILEKLPASLISAINCYFIVCAIRLARGQQKEHNSMLIHVSWYVQWIDKVAVLVNNYLQNIKKLFQSNDEEIVETFKLLWETEFKDQTNIISNRLGYDDPELIEHEWDEIAPLLQKAIDKIEVRAVHGKKKGLEYKNIAPLNYNDHKNGLSVIAVGGNKLSRGLTLEGLSVSYFLRASRFYDTLLQMGRWFGYRPGYADLCRLFTTSELVLWYQHIARATEELKEQFDIMDLADRNPKNFGLKVRTAPGMLMISSAAKIKGATDLSLSFSGDLIETYILPKSMNVLSSNLLVLRSFIDGLGSLSGKERQNQNYIWENVSYAQIDTFIANYKINQQNINSNLIRAYIGQQLKLGYLNKWTVVLINNTSADDNSVHTLSTSNLKLKIGYTFRSEVEKKDSAGNVYIDPDKYFIRRSHIISPPHEFLDMDDTDVRYIKALDETIKSSKKGDAKVASGKFIRKYRNAENALLIIYLLDPEGFGSGMPAVGYAISFPEIKDDIKIPYKANQQFIEELFGIPEDAEENPEDEDD